MGGSMCQIEHMSEETKQKISNSNRGKKRTPEVIKRNREIKYGARWMNNGEEQKYVLKQDIQVFLDIGWNFGMLEGRKSPPASEDRKNNIRKALLGKKKSQEHIEKHREALKNKKMHWYTNGVSNLSICEGEPIPEGFYRGRVVSEESKIKNRNSHINKIHI